MSNIQELIKQALSKYLVNPSDEYIDKLIAQFSQPGYFLEYTDDGFIAGMLTNNNILFPGVLIALEVALWVRPEARGSRLGGKLYKKFEQWARDNQAVYILQGMKTKNAREFSKVYIKELV